MRILAGVALVAVLGLAVVLESIARGPVPLAGWLGSPGASFALAWGVNPAPVQLQRPALAPLSPLARLGERIFFDTSLSSSRRLSCASCHDPGFAFAPGNDLPAQFGGPEVTLQGARAVPSLMYLQTQPVFSIGPDPGGDDAPPVALPQLGALAQRGALAVKTAQSTAQSAENIVPQGGLFWDGRADTLPDQALGPLLNPFEMDGGSMARLAAKLQAAPYASEFPGVLPPGDLASPEMLVSDAVIAIARFETEDARFDPYSSKYDAWLEGKTRLSRAEMRGYVLFNDPAKGDCGACHLDQPGPQGQPPLFTDHQFEALGVPRNAALGRTADPGYFDLGICGPYRTASLGLTAYCGMFLTPSLRNVATRQAFFHNGVYHTLRQVLDFYDFRDTRPEKIYPLDAAGHVLKYDDLPTRYWGNIDNTDPPFDRKLGDAPPLSEGEEEDIIAFLRTLTDGYEGVR